MISLDSVNKEAVPGLISLCIGMQTCTYKIIKTAMGESYCPAQTSAVQLADTVQSVWSNIIGLYGRQLFVF